MRGGSGRGRRRSSSSSPHGGTQQRAAAVARIAGGSGPRGAAQQQQPVRRRAAAQQPTRRRSRSSATTTTHLVGALDRALGANQVAHVGPVLDVREGLPEPPLLAVQLDRAVLVGQRQERQLAEHPPRGQPPGHRHGRCRVLGARLEPRPLRRRLGRGVGGVPAVRVRLRAGRAHGLGLVEPPLADQRQAAVGVGRRQRRRRAERLELGLEAQQRAHLGLDGRLVGPGLLERPHRVALCRDGCLELGRRRRRKEPRRGVPPHGSRGRGPARGRQGHRLPRARGRRQVQRLDEHAHGGRAGRRSLERGEGPARQRAALCGGDRVVKSAERRYEPAGRAWKPDHRGAGCRREQLEARPTFFSASSRQRIRMLSASECVNR